MGYVTDTIRRSRPGSRADGAPRRARACVATLSLFTTAAGLGACHACAPSSGAPADGGPLDALIAAADGGRLPDAGEADAPPDPTEGAGGRGSEEDAGAEGLAAGAGCPPEMVRVARRFCVDRYEASLVDMASGQTLSPYYPPVRRTALFIEKLWDKQRHEVGDAEAREMPLPILPAWQKARDFEPRAVSKRGVVPHGYLSGEIAERACKNAGKRLCALEEWRIACRGEQDRQFPYGPAYEERRCNSFREGHPAMILHDNASIGHTDPRLNLVRVSGRPLLRRTGDTKACQSEWEGDAIADMVGNLDEWIDDPEGTFAGGFYARSRKEGCDATISTHSYDYYDYSTGVRCCKDLDRQAPRR